MTKKLSFMLLAACGVTFSPLALAQQSQATGPIVVQGAMPVEAERFAQRLDNPREEQIGGWRFWHGTLDGYPVVVSETQKGMSNAAAATAIAATRFHPVAIINQGTAGGHDPALKVYDIVLGKYSVSLGAFKTPKKAAGEGSDSRQWQPMDLLASKGSAGEDKNVHSIRQFPADAKLLAAAEGVKASYTRGNVVEGVIGSTDVWNSELDRIRHFRASYHTSVEEMETASAAQIAASFAIPFIGIRVLSNNITNQGKYDPQTGLACQDYVYQVVKAYIANAATH
ncbi:MULTISPECIES: 5'-methylthioadenosine/S-adenosylhomocysteine nucleosidase [unclassified Serratia (in: enterobacteria)]|uniref:5'-methylthioadenosine/S-adenosylhomocysteine nucleosidase n=1 Tax=unclassified Serratia (in: enterobacteria) TaxID=2647522 RepID=UPI002ED4F190|nr:5'-methylthioadenosine/S-adenosylhomocysteine nucleosidase [Serratia sp. C2(2)]MEE4447334.1 5'-methylthioadenosine/S-adenosylhomocysteine nucleosidase [Serratia sp. C2(1)]